MARERTHSFRRRLRPSGGFRAPYRVIWGVLAILTEGRSGRAGGPAWWVALVAAYVPRSSSPSCAGMSSLYQALVVGMQVRLWVLGIGVVLALAVAFVVEREQWTAFLRRDPSSLECDIRRPSRVGDRRECQMKRP